MFVDFEIAALSPYRIAEWKSAPISKQTLRWVCQIKRNGNYIDFFRDFLEFFENLVSPSELTIFSSFASNNDKSTTVWSKNISISATTQ